MQDSFSEEDVKKVAQGAGISLIGSAVGKGLYFLSQIIMARILGVEMFGLYALGFAAVKICEIIARVGLNIGGMRFVSVYKDNNPAKLKGILISATTFSFISGMVVGSLLVVFSSNIAHSIFRNANLIEPLQYFAFSIPFLAGMTVACSLLQGFHIIKYTIYTRDYIQPLMNIIFIVVFYCVWPGINGVIFAFTLSYAIAFIVGVAFYRKIFPGFSDKKIHPIYEIKDLLLYSIPLFTAGLLQYFFSWTDTLMLGILSTAKDVGIYRAASQLPLVMTLALFATNSIYAPLAADLYTKGEMKRLLNIFRTTTRWISCLSVPVFIILVLSSEEVMMIFGEEYVKTGSTVLIILAFAQLINCITGGVGFTLIMTGQQKLWLMNTVIVLLTNVLMNLILIPYYGSIGAAISCGGATVLLNVLCLLQVKKLYGLNPFSFHLLRLFFPSVCTVIVLFFVNRMDIDLIYFALAIKIVIVTFIFVIYYFFSKLEEEDKYLLIKIRQKFLAGTKK